MLIKKLFLIIGLGIFLATMAGVGEAKQGGEIVVGAPPYGPTFQQAIAAVGARNLTLTVPAGTYPIKADFTVPANVYLRVENGAVFSIGSGASLTLKGPLEAGPYQIFSWYGTGKIVFGARGVCREVYARWFGADNTGNRDSAAATQAAINATYASPSYVGKVFLHSGDYKVSQRINLRWNVTLSGDRCDNTRILPSADFPTSKASGYGVFAYGYPGGENPAINRDNVPLENVSILMTSVPVNAEIAGIWFNKHGRRSCLRNIAILGRRQGKQIGIHLSHWQYNDDGTHKKPYVQNNHNSLSMENISMAWCCNANGALYVEQNTDAQFQEYRGLQFNSNTINVTFGGYNSTFSHCAFEGVANELKADGSGGLNPRFNFIGGMVLNFRDCYWDGGWASILLWNALHGHPAGVAYADYQLEGYNAGWAGNLSNVANVLENKTRTACIKTGPRTLKVAGADVRGMPTVCYGVGGYYLWVETSGRAPHDVRYRYLVDKAIYDGTDSTIILNPKVGPDLDNATAYYYRTLDVPIQGNQRSSFATFEEYLVANYLTVGVGSTALSRMKKTKFTLDVGTIQPGAAVEKKLTDTDSNLSEVVYAISPSFALPPNIVIRYGRQQNHINYLALRNDPIYLGNGSWTKESGNLWHATMDAANTPKWLYYDCVKGAAVANKADLVGANKWWHDTANKRIYLYSPDAPGNHQILVGFAWAPGSKDWYLLNVK